MRSKQWFEGIQDCHQYAQSYVLVTVLDVIGSSPREQGTKMLVTNEQAMDTIGGGQLEFDVIKQARKMLNDKQTYQKQISYPLASKLGQCCGGKVEILFEVFCQHTQHLAVFGAGHVAKQLIPIIGQLPLKVDWIDNRPELFPNDIPQSVTTYLHEEPQWWVNQLPENSWVVIMTHCHQLDFEIVRHCLQRPDIPFVGLIGSQNKARKFNQRLTRREIQYEDRLVCPVGLTNIPGKKPIEVAVSIAGQIIARLNEESNSEDIKNNENIRVLTGAN